MGHWMDLKQETLEESLAWNERNQQLTTAVHAFPSERQQKLCLPPSFSPVSFDDRILLQLATADSGRTVSDCYGKHLDILRRHSGAEPYNSDTPLI